MKHERIWLSDAEDEAYIDTYICDPIKSFTRKAILVIPGGGYSQVCSDREGEPIAQAFIPYGYNAFVLHYYTKREKPFPIQLIQAAKAIKHIKDNADTYGIDPEQLFVVGFSAGGHLAASCGVLWKLPEIYNEVDMPYGYNKPNGVMLIYPVISSEYHGFSFQHLHASDAPSADSLAASDIEKHVDADSAPAFIFHTVTDTTVNVKNSLSLAWAYSDAGVQYEMHVYPDAPHGIALANRITECQNPKWFNSAMAEWVRHAAVWADSICEKNKIKEI